MQTRINIMYMNCKIRKQTCKFKYCWQIMYIFGKIETMLTIYFNTSTSIHDIRIKYLFASKIDIKYAAGLMKCQYLKLSESITKRTQWSVRPVKTRISLGILPVWSQASLFAWRNLGFLADAQPDWSVRWEHRSFVVGFVMPRLDCLSANQVWTGPCTKGSNKPTVRPWVRPANGQLNYPELMSYIHRA